MEALLPSEIARLVLGYLQDQKCTEAARLFLETSPHLQECRTVASTGRRFSTRVSGLTLIDIIEKFSAISGMIQDRISRVADCEQMKHCGDLLEQLRFLVEETKGQRFVVNINVPSQSNQQVLGSSPILAGNTRKRRHSNSDRERCKRMAKSSSQASEPSESTSNQSIHCQTLEATPLESLPGHVDYVGRTERRQSKVMCENVSETTDYVSSKASCDDKVHSTSSKENICQPDGGDATTVSKVDSEQRPDASGGISSWEKCTAATSTEELLSFSNMEVQTTPYDMHESESETNDEPIENLSLLTKELLNRTELQERIAENINKAMLPTDISLREELLNESVGGEINTSIMTEVNNAIKSIVEATESDPVFEKFLDEIIGGPQVETDTSPDEDSDGKTGVKPNDGLQDKDLGAITSDICSPEHVLTQNKNAEDETTEVPLKQRLRSSSRQQTARLDEDMDKFKDQEKDNALEDQNAAAVLSIINANISNNIKSENELKKGVDEPKELLAISDESAVKSIAATSSVKDKSQCVQSAKPSSTLEIDKSSDIVSNTDNTNVNNANSTNNANHTNATNANHTNATNANDATSTVNATSTTSVTSAASAMNAISGTNAINTNAETKPKKNTIRRPRPTKPKRDESSELITEQEIMTMPTLIVCSKEEISSFLAVNPPYPTNTVRSITSTSNSHFIPIAPKDPNKMNEKKIDTLYLRTVNVAQKVPVSVTSSLDPKNFPLQPKTVQQSVQKNSKVSKKMSIVQASDSTVQCIAQPIMEPIETNKFIGIESITLYGNENSAKTLLDGVNMPAINIDENISLSGTGLSPYLKFNNNKSIQSHTLSDIDLSSVIETMKAIDQPALVERDEEQVASSSRNVSRDVIAKRTPRSLLKSRSKNNRLSLSTPRRRSSHVRALDFSTPTKASSSSKKASQSGSPNSRPICRTSLFKSPPFSNSATDFQRIKSPVKRPLQAPIATRSPAPKLMGGWEKYNGVGVIIGDVSPPSNAAPVADPISTTPEPKKPPVKSRVAKDSWDADLRRIAQISREDECVPQTRDKKKEGTKSKKTTARKVDKARGAKSKGTRKSLEENGGTDSVKRSVKNREFSSDERNEKDENVAQDEDDKQKSVKQEESKACNPEELCVEKTAINAIVINATATVSFDKNDSGQNLAKSETTPQFPSNLVTSTPAKVDSTSTDKGTTEKKVVKKYAQLKTISTSVKKPERKDTSNATTMQSMEFAKVSDVSQHMIHLPDMMELETPRKLETPLGIPPTPRLLSPSSNLVTPFTKICDESSKVRSFISTPEFPTTPCIALTPKHAEENTRDNLRKNDFNSCSPYYKPSSEQKDAEKSTIKKSSSERIPPTSYQTTTKLEITQFEVIKENLPKEEAVKELKISSNPKDAQCNAKLQTNQVDGERVEANVNESESKDRKSIDRDKYLSESDSDTTDSNTSSSTDSSSSSSSSSYSSSSKSSVSAPFSSAKKPKRAPNKIYTDTSNDSMLKISKPDLAKDLPSDNCEVSQLRNKTIPINPTISDRMDDPQMDPLKTNVPLSNLEMSPVKVFPITKTDEQLKESQKETPAKDEALLEADISETPSSSKVGVETLTNLSSKISAFISAEDNSKMTKTELARQKPRIVDVQCIPKSGSIRMMRLSDRPEPEAVRLSAMINGEFVTQLEEKRQRMIAKFRDAPKTNGAGGKPRHKRNVLTVSNKASMLRTANLLKKNRLAQKNDNYLVKKRTELKKIVQSSKAKGNTKDTENVGVETQESTNNNEENSEKILEDKISKIQNDEKEDVNRDSVETVVENEARVQNQNCNSNLDKMQESMRKFENSESQQTCSIKNDTNSDKTSVNTNKDSSEQKEVVLPESISSELEKPEVQNVVENERDKARDYVGLAEKSKVDQVKRDLFSDEESDKKASCAAVSSKSQDTVPSKSQEIDNEKSTVATTNLEEENPTENVETKQELSSVLQCLQLVPACKADNMDESNENIVNTTTSNSVVYHFVYDDSAPVRKRRRRYSNQELEFQVNVEVNCEDYKCVRMMTPTDYEEIFNIPPKSRKRLTSKRSPSKTENTDGSEAKTSKNNLCLKTTDTKPLATSSPFIKSPTPKVKKSSSKITPIPEEDVQTDGKRKQRNEKTGEATKDHSAKRKRKLSEIKESKQTEKKQHTTNPQALLCNLDLDEFLTSVHGPA